MNIHLLIICVISYCLAVMALYAQPVNRSPGFDALVPIEGKHQNIGDEESDCVLPIRSEPASGVTTASVRALFWKSSGMSSPQKDGSIGISLIARRYAAWTISDGSCAAVIRGEEIKLAAHAE